MIAPRVTQAIRRPLTTAIDVGARVAPGRAHARVGAAARRSGITSLYLVVSLDCDTDRDIEVAEDVHERLVALGVTPAYAVAGELLRSGADVWRRIHATGAEFMNHGGVAHAKLDRHTGEVTSTLFYDDLSEDGVAADVRLGHESVGEVLGAAPAGFRTPHFGTFQRARQLRFLHGLLKPMGYRWSSSTAPEWAFRRGPVFDTFGLPEVPVSGMSSRPLRPLDTWACFYAPDRVLGPDDFRREGDGVVGRLVAAGAGVLNIYGDPMHVHEQDVFFDAIAAWAARLRVSTLPAVVAAAAP